MADNTIYGTSILLAATGSSGGGSGGQNSIIVNVDSGSEVTATKNGVVLSGTSVDGTVNIPVTETGTWTVVATKDGISSNTVEVVVTDEFKATLLYADSTLDNNDWATISKIARAKLGANFWEIGDRKKVSFLSKTVGALSMTNVSAYCFIIGFDHNEEVEGLGIDFQFGKTALTGGTDICFVDGSYVSLVTSGFIMNTSNTNTNGWKSSYMRSIICPAFVAALPLDMQEVLVSTPKYTDNVGSTSNVQSNMSATNDTMFLLSEYEVFGSRSYANSYESEYQKQYTYYYAGNSRIKYKHSDTATAADWWLRSPNSSNSTNFCNVNTDGSANNNNASNSNGFADFIKPFEKYNIKRG